MTARTSCPLRAATLVGAALAIVAAGCASTDRVAGSAPRVDYDPVENVTTYSAFPAFPTVGRPRGGPAVAHDVRAFYTCPSHATCTPEFVRVGLVRAGGDAPVLGARSVTVTADGRAAAYEADWQGAVPGPRAASALVWTMTLADFERLAAARAARFRVGDVDLDAPWDRREPLRRLASVARGEADLASPDP